MHIDGEGEGEANTEDFSDAFAEFTGGPADEAAPTDEEQKPEAEAPEASAEVPGAEAPVEAASDPWANAPPELIAERDKIKAVADRAEQTLRSQNGRIAALQRQIEGASKAAPQTPPAKDEPKEGEEQARQERLKQLRDEYPDVAGPILDELERTLRTVDNFRDVAQSVIGDREAVREATELQALEKAHPDWRVVAADDNFGAWLLDQPQSVIDQANSKDAREVSAALTLFKFGQEEAVKAAGVAPPVETKPDARRARQLEGSRAVTSKPTPAASGAPSDFDGAFATFAKKAEASAVR